MMGSLTYNWPLTKYNQMRMVITICLLEQVRFFPNSLTGAFTCYLTFPRMSIFTWNEMERDFNTLFFRAEPTEGFGRWVEKRRHGNELLIMSSRKRLCLCFLPYLLPMLSVKSPSMAFVEYYRVVGELPCLAYASRPVSSLSQGTISSIGLSEGISFC